MVTPSLSDIEQAIEEADEARKHRNFEQASFRYEGIARDLRRLFEEPSLIHLRVVILKKLGSLYHKLGESAYERAVCLALKKESPPDTSPDPGGMSGDPLSNFTISADPGGMSGDPPEKLDEKGSNG